MNVLSIQNVAKTVNDTPLFENVTLGLDAGEKVGIVGKNGAGKSTFLKVLTGNIALDEGSISIMRDAEMIALEQSVSFEEGSSVKSFFYQINSKKITLIKAYEEAIKQGDDKEYERLIPLLEECDAWDAERKYVSFLTDLEFKHPLDTAMSELSGGEQKKVAIARLLSLSPAIMLLDEPTNHLDIKTIEYLENYLRESQSAVIIVTHDRYILNSVCTTIWELDRNHFYRHPGSYEAYIERRSERIEMEQKEQNRLASILRRELVWLARGPQARTGKDKNRKDRIEAMLSAVHNVQDVEQKEFSSLNRRLGKNILDIDDISFSYGERVLFSHFTYNFKKGDKIGVVGDNGSGKSTLLDILTGHLKPTSGSVTIGQNTHFGYYDQLGRNLDTNKTALEYIEEIGSRIQSAEGEVSSSRFLELFGFPPSKQRTPISVFSGGEKRRLYLIGKLALNPNFLVLDEPTNDLDIKTMENLEEYIAAFPGPVLIVSHDRAFLDCTTEYLFIIENGKITFTTGHYSDYRKSKEIKKGKVVEVKVIEDRKSTRVQKGLTYKEKKEYESLSDEIDKLTLYIAKLEESFQNPNPTEDGSLQERSKKYTDAKTLLEEKSDRYLELAMKEEE